MTQTRNCPPPGPHMGAAYNALYEGGTKDDILAALTRAIVKIDELRTKLADAEKKLSDAAWERDATQWGR